MVIIIIAHLRSQIIFQIIKEYNHVRWLVKNQIIIVRVASTKCNKKVIIKVKVTIYN